MPTEAGAVASFDITATPQVGILLAPTQFDCSTASFTCPFQTPDGLLLDGSWVGDLAAVSGRGEIRTTFVPGVEDILSFTDPHSSVYTETFNAGSFRNYSTETPCSTCVTLATELTLSHVGDATDGGAYSGGVGAGSPNRAQIRFEIENSGTEPFVVPWVAIPRLSVVNAPTDLGDTSDVRATLNLIFDNATTAVGDITYVAEFGALTLETAPKLTVGAFTAVSYARNAITFADGSFDDTIAGFQRNIPFQTWFTTTVQPGATGLFFMEFATQANLTTVERSQVIPLPGALPLMAAGLGGLALLRRRRKAA